MKTTSLAFLTFGIVFLLASQTTPANDDDNRGMHGSHTTGFTPVQNKLYAEECGGCHMAYQPDLLPARSWKSIMSGLDDHFGDNAEVGMEEYQSILDYLTENSMDNSTYHNSRELRQSISDNETPLRITQIPYFKSEHLAFPKRILKNNPGLNSLSQCEVCHRDAEKGYYSEREIDVPNIGKWYE